MVTTPPRWSPYLYLGVLLAVAGSVVYFIVQGALGPKEIGSAFLAMVGTFVGALFAFRLNESKEHDQLVKDRRAALNRALFVVERQYKGVRSLAKLLAQYKSEVERAFNCPAFRPPSYSDLTQDFDTLAFLLEAAEPNVLMRLTIEQEGFYQTMETLRIRNEFYVSEVQPAIAKGGFNRRIVPAQELEAAFGEWLFGAAMNQATFLYANVSQAEKRLLAMHSELFAAAKKLYPDAKFIKLVAEA